jgi:hypothetical protein
VYSSKLDYPRQEKELLARSVREVKRKLDLSKECAKIIMRL